jgi:hypothetical protein
MRRRLRLVILVVLAAVALFALRELGLLGGAEKAANPPEATNPPPPPLEGLEDEEPPVPTIAGTVTDGAGKPLARALLKLVALSRGHRREVQVRTDAEGRYENGELRSGDLIYVQVVRIGHPTFRQRFEDRALSAKETLTVDIVLPRKFDLRGHVKALGGAPVEGARVEFGIWKAETDDVGRFHVKDIDSRVLREDPPRLETKSPGFADDRKDLRLDTEEAIFDDIEVVLTPR